MAFLQKNNKNIYINNGYEKRTKENLTLFSIFSFAL